jgi:hypothetical protein
MTCLTIVIFILITEESLAPSVLAFDDILSGAFAAFQQSSKTIGGDVAKHADLVNQGFT